MTRTQAQVNARLKAYKAGTVDSVNRVKNWTSYDNNYGQMEPGAIDADNYYHAQCADLTIDFIEWVTEGKWRPQGNAKDYPHMNFPSGFKVHKNLPSTVAKTGWIAVYTTGPYARWGHIGIVYSPGNTNTFTILEQNINGLANKKPQTRKDNYYGLTHFIEIPVKKSAATKVKETAKKAVAKATPKKKVTGKKILIVAGHGNSDPGAVGNGTTERDFIRQNITPQVTKLLKAAGHKVELYGGTKQNQNLFADTAYGDRIGDTKNYGMYWAKRQKFDIIVEFHLDAASPSASGGHVIISSSFKADQIDKNIDKALRKTVGTIRPIDPRNNLLNANVSAKLNMNYRLVELGFITSKKDMDYIKKNLGNFNKEIAEAIHGGAIGYSVPAPSTPKPSPSKPSTNLGKWKKNNFNTYYMTEKARFTCGNQPIQVRTVGPKLSAPKAYMFQPGGYCDYDEVMVSDGFVWIGYTWKGVRYYLPVRTASGTPPNHSVGKAWGTFK